MLSEVFIDKQFNNVENNDRKEAFREAGGPLKCQIIRSKTSQWDISHFFSFQKKQKKSMKQKLEGLTTLEKLCHMSSTCPPMVRSYKTLCLCPGINLT